MLCCGGSARGPCTRNFGRTSGVAHVQWVSPYEVCGDVAGRGGCRGCHASIRLNRRPESAKNAIRTPFLHRRLLDGAKSLRTLILLVWSGKGDSNPRPSAWTRSGPRLKFDDEVK